ncbi:SH3 domain-containing protein [Ruegeria arenilitoris]|uniref:SH3 domain-containing protein n=1 Tax=Ruegeria arenilitoris TaxID=1173585 RepID=UPI00147BB0E9|nr:SH3 domain-containing protein [Ruegeria arenilitoris]
MKLKFAVAIALICTSAIADRQTFPPVDQADRDATLVAFRAELLAKIQARDIEAVVASACPEIYLSHGGEGGPNELRANLIMNSEGADRLVGVEASEQIDAYWTALQNTLSQPGYFDDQGEFWMPHQWQITLPARLDPAITYFVTGENVSLRTGAFQGASISALISHEVIIVPQFQPDSDYQQVLLTDGTTGFMHKDYLWSMIGYRAAIVKSEDGDWQLCSFVTGD